MEELRGNIKKLADEKNMTEIEIITELQAAAALTNNEELLEDLCKIKREMLGI